MYSTSRPGDGGTEGWINPGRRYNESKTYFEHEQREREQRLRENDKQDMQETCAVITVSDIRAAKRLLVRGNRDREWVKVL